MSTNITPAYEVTDTYRAYIRASQRCADAMAGISTEPETGRRGQVIGYWLSIDGRTVESGTKSGLFSTDHAARERGHLIVSGEWEQILRRRQEEEIREAHQQELAASGRLATERQIAYILDLIERRRRDGDDSGFMTGPTDREGIAALTRDEASTYITSLKGEY